MILLQYVYIIYIHTHTHQQHICVAVPYKIQAVAVTDKRTFLLAFATWRVLILDAGKNAHKLWVMERDRFSGVISYKEKRDCNAKEITS